MEVFDAEFILSLRSNQHKARFLHPIDSEIEKQREWIVDYKKRESLDKEYYFVIEERVLPDLKHYLVWCVFMIFWRILFVGGVLSLLKTHLFMLQ